MPKYAVHHLVYEAAAAELIREDGNFSFLRTEQAFGNLGAVGPDLFFFSPEYEVFDTVLDFYQAFRDVKSFFEDIEREIQQVEDAIERPFEETLPAAHALTELIERSVDETVRLANNTQSMALFRGILEGVNGLTDVADLRRATDRFFGMFVPAFHSNAALERDWFWFDCLHYRKTGEFARQLVNRARTDRTRAYAMGYLSHIATDLVGHAYVNQTVGGPFRMHVQRHVTAENWMDAWAYHQHYRGAVEDVGRAGSVNAGLVRNMRLGAVIDPATGQLNREISELLSGALAASYNDRSNGRRVYKDPLSVDEIEQTFQNFWSVLGLLEEQYVEPPREPFEGAAEILAQAVSDLLEPPPPAPNRGAPPVCSAEDIFSFGFTDASRDCYNRFFDNTADWLDWVGQLTVWLIDRARRLLDLILASLAFLPVAVVLALLYGVQLALFEAYQWSRRAFSELGLIYPEPWELNSSHAAMLTTPFQCAIGACLTDDTQYPRVETQGGDWLNCPQSGLELPRTAANATAPFNNETGAWLNPHSFMYDEEFSYEALEAYAGAQTIEETEALQQGNCGRIGNAKDLTRWMVRTAYNGNNATEEERSVLFTNWNLDSDRGYGSKSWMGNNDDNNDRTFVRQNPPDNRPVNITYTDN